MERLQGKRIALIGGAGFVGHHLALRLREICSEVLVVDSLQVNNLLYYLATEQQIENRDLYVAMLRERIELLHRAKVHLNATDARDYLKISLVLGAFKPQIIVHLAAVAHADRSNKDPYSTFDHSLRTLENTLDYARGPESCVEQFIYFSSSMVYGNFPGGCVTEDTPCNPLGIYGALKYAGEKLVIAYHQVFGLPYTIIRPSALYGPRCVSKRVIQIFIERAIARKEIVIRGNGSDALDFTYIDDLIQGVILCMGNPAAYGQTFNMTYGQARTLTDVLRILRTHFPSLLMRYEPRDTLMPERGTLSIQKAQEKVGYRPLFPLENGLEAYVEWYRSFRESQKLDAGEA
mgnify:CR=1 FL=1